MNKIKVMTVVGTRPEIIKLSQVIKELDINVDHTIVHTGQNYDYELNEIFFKQLDIIENQVLDGKSFDETAKENNLKISVKKMQLRELIKTETFMSKVFDLDIDGSPEKVLPREIAYDPVSDEPIHIDFIRIIKGSILTLEIPVRFINSEKSPGLKKGGVLNIVRSQVELNCPAISIPEKLTVDLEGLNVGHTIHISSIELPEGCTPTITDRDFTVATIAAPRGGLGDDDENEETEEVSEDTEESKSDS